MSIGRFILKWYSIEIYLQMSTAGIVASDYGQ